MRIAIVAESFLPNVNGVSNSVQRVLEHLHRTGHQALVIAPDTPPGEPPAPRVHAGIPVHRVPARMLPKVPSLPLGVPTAGMLRALRGFGPDVIHLASPALLGYGGLLAARRLGVRTVAVYQTDLAGFAASYGMPRAAGPIWRWLRHLHGNADRTLAPSAAAIDDLRAHRIPRVHHWPRGVDVIGFAPSRRDERLRRRWDHDGRPVIGYVGRLAPEKQVHRLAPLADRDDLRLVIVGDGVERAALQSRMPTAIFTGELHGPDLAAAFASLDVFVHPGEHETFCQTVQEALASGVPVLAADAGGPRDLVESFRTGLLVEPGRFAAVLAESIDHLLAQRPRYAAAARRSVLERTWPSVCDRLLAHYRAVLDRQRPPAQWRRA